LACETFVDLVFGWHLPDVVFGATCEGDAQRAKKDNETKQ